MIAPPLAPSDQLGPTHRMAEPPTDPATVFQCIEDGDLPTLERLFLQDPTILQLKEPRHGEPVLSQAAWHGQLQVVDWLAARGAGRREILSDNRFIHCKPWFPRLVEGLVVEGGLRSALLDRSSMFQIGGQPGHRTEELVFAMKSVISKYRMEGKPVVLQMFDISKYFDKETIEDAVITCENRGANKKATRVWHKLNQNTKIQVRTGVGMTKEAEVGAVLGQGTLGGALISQAVLDDGVMEEFQPGDGGLEYGAVALAPLMYQDDLLQGVLGLQEARVTNRKVNKIMKERRLSLNKEKSVVVIMGTKKQKREITKEIENNPLFCGEVETKEKEVWKWLGQYVSGNGLGDSVAQTVASREGKVRGACLEIAQICNDWRARAAGGLDTALVLWEVCVVPSLLHGCGTWVEVTAATERKLNNLQAWFVRLVMQVGKGTPRVALTWETGLLDMKLRIWMEKLMMIIHIRSLDDDSLAKLIYEEQKLNCWPGLSKETKDICKKLDIEDVNSTNMSKEQFKERALAACKKTDEESMRKMAEKSVKCERIMSDPYGRKDYCSQKSINVGREHFKTRTGMLKLAGNYKHDQRFKASGWLCKCRMAIEDESHLMSGLCPTYGDIREKYDLDTSEDMVLMFREIMTRRDALEDETMEDEVMEDETDAVVMGNITGVRQPGSTPGQAGLDMFV